MPAVPQAACRALLIVLQLAGCTSWHVEALLLTELIVQRRPDRLRVEGFDGKRVMYYAPEGQGYGLRGRPSGT